MRRLNVVSLFDILPGLKAGDSYGTFRRKPKCFGGFLLHRVA